MERVLAILGALVVVYTPCFETTEVVSGSMRPAFDGNGPGESGNDWVLIERVSTRFVAPPRGSILQYQTPEGLRVAKRVVGFPGERLRIVEGCLEVNGELGQAGVPSGYVRSGRLRPRTNPHDDYLVQPGLFVLGDNSGDSWDSRFCGEVPDTRWRGRAVAVVWPPSRWSWVW